MKVLKSALILGLGVVGGFVAGTVVVVKSAVQSDTIRGAIVQDISDRITTALYGERPKYSKNNSRVSYNGYSNAKYGEVPTPPKTFKDTDFIFQTRGEAEETLKEMIAILNIYRLVYVSDLYDLVGAHATGMMSKYGWTDLKGVNVVPIKDGYIIHLPEATLLKQ